LPFAERGFHAASVAEVASRAGLTTGAIYSNFRSREDLFLAVIQEAPPWERLVHAAVQAARGIDSLTSRRLLKLQLEFALLALGDPALLHEFVADLRADRVGLAELLATGGPAPRPEFSPSPDQLATAITATIQGLLQHRFLDPTSVPEELAAWATQALLHVAARE